MLSLVVVGGEYLGSLVPSRMFTGKVAKNVGEIVTWMSQRL